MARIGTQKHPAVVRVQTAPRAEQVMALCREQGIACIVGIEPDQREDLTDLERALHPPEPVRALARPGRNDPCPCGSGQKTKRCCPQLAT